MTHSRAFPIEDILTFTTGKMLSPRRAEAIASVCVHITGGPLTAPEIGIFYGVIRDEILKQHPDLDDVRLPGPDETPEEWIAEAHRTYGSHRTLAAMPGFDCTDGPSDHERTPRSKQAPKVELASERDKTMEQLREFLAQIAGLAGKAAEGFAKIAADQPRIDPEAVARGPVQKVIDGFTGVVRQPKGDHP